MSGKKEEVEESEGFHSVGCLRANSLNARERGREIFGSLDPKKEREEVKFAVLMFVVGTLPVWAFFIYTMWGKPTEVQKHFKNQNSQ